MEWYRWLAVAACFVCVLSCLLHVFRLIRLGKPNDYARSRGDVSSAVAYSISGAMSPLKKESAYLHIPTYTAGLLYHIGTFLSLALFVVVVSNKYPGATLGVVLAGILFVSMISGFGILIKRIGQSKLRALSNPDDYISNLMVSLLHGFTALVLLQPVVAPAYFILISILFVYLPLGKLKHTVYFFAARYHLGFFYGWRGVWPPK